MARNYVPIDLPERRCIVCKATFKPSRLAHVFYPSYECWSALKTKERLFEIQHIQAAVRQRYNCHFCSKNLLRIGTIVFLDPSKEPEDITPEEVVASHTSCRMIYYRDVAEGTTPQEPLAA